MKGLDHDVTHPYRSCLCFSRRIVRSTEPILPEVFTIGISKIAGLIAYGRAIVCQSIRGQQLRTCLILCHFDDVVGRTMLELAYVASPSIIRRCSRLRIVAMISDWSLRYASPRDL